MARKRMIDPSFWIDEKLGTVEPIVRLLFMGLISQADDEGRLNGHPALIKSLIFPYDHGISLIDVENWLGFLSTDERKVICRYEVDHQKYILITNFKKHQTINKPQKSKLPAPIDDYGNTTVGLPEGDGSITAQKKLIEEKLKEEEEKGREEEVNPPDPYSNPHKDRIHKLINDCKIEEYNLYHLDEFFSFIGMVDIEVIEASIKKGQAKHVNYAIKALKGMIQDGITKKDQLFMKPKVGETIEKPEGQLRHEQSAPEDKPITGGKTGALPSKWANVLPLHNVSG